jgi:tRNA (uracil-5-)-methyltransferase
MVGDYLFEYDAGSFFQSNNSLLPHMVSHVCDLIFAGGARPTYLVDPYCGEELFGISRSAGFERVAGIELSQTSIACAKRNAQLNSISSDKISFLSGEASNIFATVKDFPPEQTVVIIDPPRKGCDDLFLKQLVNFRCRTVVYVSCNVHTQARDIGTIVRSTMGDGEGRRYRMETLRGFDLFPQTAHVESVALLRLY